ncbi:MAG: DUF4330 domain-containing protein [Clostridia bacterium]|nr:DUF4330 domain-containing protein [Clostridia bacterium]
MKNNTQKKHRFNIIDFVLIVTVLACIVGIAVRYNLRSTLTKESDTATVTVVIHKLLEENADHLVVGDTYFYQTTEKTFGTLKSVKTSPAKLRLVDQSGTVSIVHHPDRVDAVCTLEVRGYYSEESGFMIGGTTYIGCGSNILVRSQNLETEWLVLDIEVHE